MVDMWLMQGLLAGLGIALMAGPLGCVVVWQRMAYVGDAFAHAMMLGVVVALALHLPVTAGMAVVGVSSALLLTLSRQRAFLSNDMMLGMIAQGALAFGMIGLHFLPQAHIDISRFLFGDVLMTRMQDVVVIYLLAACVTGWLWRRWRALLLLSIHRDIAVLHGVNATRIHAELMLMLALVITCAIHMVGMLLITALLIIPAATARRFATRPEQMLGMAILAATVAVLGGFMLSWCWDLPTGPAIVAVAIMVCGGVWTAGKRFQGYVGQ